MSQPATPASIQARPLPARNAPMRFGKSLPPRQTVPPALPLARGNEAKSSRASVKSQAIASLLWCSSASPLVLIQKTAQLIQLFFGRSPALQRMNHQFACRSLEHPLQDVADELPLGLRRRLACLINVRPLLFVSAHGALASHDLKQLQNSGVAEILLFPQRFVHLADRRRPALP